MTNKSLFLINKMLKKNGQHKSLKFAIFRSKCLDILEKEKKIESIIGERGVFIKKL